MNLLATIVAFLPLLQDPGFVPPTTAAIATGAVRDGRLAFTAMGMGRGGVEDQKEHSRVTGLGRFLTPGGVRIWAKAEGVKLDFPTGAELLISPTLRIHLRSGEQTAPFPDGVELRLGDATRLRVVPDRRGGSARRVEVDVDRPDLTGAWLLQDGVRTAAAALRRPTPFSGTALFVGGSGDALFTATPMGPLIVLERILASPAAEQSVPHARLLVIGESLRESLREMPKNTPARSVQFPQLRQVAERLSEGADQFFAEGLTLRPQGALGALVIPLVGEWHLAVHVHEPGPITLGLSKSGASAPAVEWTVMARTELRLVRPGAGQKGVPRYFQQGIEVKDAAEDVLALSGRQRDVARARKVLLQLGAKAPQQVEAVGRRR